MTGPGVSVSSDLNSTGMGLDVPSTFGPFNLQMTSSYTIFDANMGASSRVAFNTSATVMFGAGSGGPGGSTTESGSGGTSISTNVGGASSNGKTAKTLGTFAATVTTAGKPTLTIGGNTVKTAKVGLYEFAITDRSKKIGLLVGKVSKTPITLSGASSIGTSSRTVSLSAGRWYFAASATGPKTYFAVK